METEEYLKQLESCKTEQEFKEIWNPDKFDWKNYSYYLCKWYNKYIKIWWNPEKFNWHYYSHFLCMYHNKDFNLWWDSKKFNWKNAKYLQEYCNKYKYIWGKNYLKTKLKGGN